MSPCGVVLLPPWCQDKSFHEFSIRTVTPYPGHTEISKIEHGLKANTLANYFLFDSLPIYKLNQSYYTKSYSSQHKPQQISLLILNMSRLSDIIPNLPHNPLPPPWSLQCSNGMSHKLPQSRHISFLCSPPQTFHVISQILFFAKSHH